MSKERRDKEKHAEDMTAGGGRLSASDLRGAEGDLPPELKAIEAELAALSPRSDRLDRERLIFLAGQQSAYAGDVSPANRDGGWRWPAAFAAMTAAAAALLVMLLFQGEPRTEVKYVEVPAEGVGNNEGIADANLPTTPPDGGRVEPSPGPPERMPEPTSRPGLLASVGLDWFQLSDRSQLGPEASYPRLLDRVLREGIDNWEPPVSTAGPGRASTPVPYRELRDSLLDNQTSERSRPGRPLMRTLLYPGANS